MRTYKYKLQNHKRVWHLDTDKRIISQAHNHFIAFRVGTTASMDSVKATNAHRTHD